MITEDYVDFETAKLLKEKGFNEPCDNYYDQSSDEPQQLTLDEMYYSYDEFLKAPTLQMTVKWLMEIHNLFIQVTVDFSDGAYPMYNSSVINLATCDKTIITGYDRYNYKEAITMAIKYCLNNLI